MKVYNEPRTTEWTGVNCNWKRNCSSLDKRIGGNISITKRKRNKKIKVSNLESCCLEHEHVIIFLVAFVFYVNRQHCAFTFVRVSVCNVLDLWPIASYTQEN